MIKSICICVLFSTISSLSASCQDLPANIETSLPLSLDINQTEMPRFEYIMDPIVERYLDFTDSLDREKLMNKGYRIQLFSNSGPSAKENAVKFQSSFLRFYEKIPSYTLWNYPNWVVRVGDYGSKLEALEFHNVIRELYPASFIISDEINVKY